MISNFNETDLENIVEELINDFMTLANHTKGLCVIKRVIEVNKNEKFVQRIIDIITANALQLVHNPYGNYAIQSALEVFLK